MESKLTAQDHALYLYGEVQHAHIPRIKGKLIGIDGDKLIIKRTSSVNLVDPRHAKPILRPISDMTKEERKAWSDSFKGSIAGLHKYQLIANPEARGTLHLIRQGFDVFNWIKKGLAIDKTTVVAA